ncbi:methyl-accepting chemotaxis protein [Methylobacterium brachythecii]|uniref:Methyl-accepting chemotaxis protein n=1 Tax=Methylobacterium brachythecii TaxID=1176177 RepID=A0A7W6F6I1_9HYPH|nr:methyl-accepting chemotaxis protein [Methylobacterium brachythecii]MBB3902328.1 methyl-accepting chemotaxis protein [Methylobacterium brachythecii]GLS42177.1 methyl-accepting chemotaxis protein [Methylobacterium brachythecii]
MSISIANRILLGFAVVTAVLIALGLYATGQIGTVRDTIDRIVSRDLMVMRQLDDLGNKARDLGVQRRNAVISVLMREHGRSVPDEDSYVVWSRMAAATDGLFADLVRESAEFRQDAISVDRMAAWDRLNATLKQTLQVYNAYRDSSDAQLKAVVAKDFEKVEASNEEVSRLYEATIAGIERTRSALDGSVVAGQRGVAEVYEFSRFSILLTLAAGVLLSVIVTWAISRAVVRPVNEVAAFVERVGTGDLTGRIAVTGQDEIGRLGTTLNAMVGGLSDLARTNRSATADLNAAAAEIRASAQEQAASVEEQFAAVQETAATVDEITHSGAQISKRATDVIATAQASAQTARAGLRAASDTAKAMDLIREQGEAVAGNIVALSEKTQAIGEIITTVNDISERTHLLSLNAAIEAAAAGESGRSFAIVAAEMKLLADQAKAATVQVRSILSEIQRGINSSVMLTEEAVKRAATGKTRTDATVRTIEEMAARVDEGVQTFQQIVASTNQQQLGIEQVMGALQNIRQASQQTAAGTREVEMASANLTELAQGLMTLAERYRL